MDGGGGGLGIFCYKIYPASELSLDFSAFNEKCSKHFSQNDPLFTSREQHVVVVVSGVQKKVKRLIDHRTKRLIDHRTKRLIDHRTKRFAQLTSFLSITIKST